MLLINKKNNEKGSALILAGIITIILVFVVASVMHYTLNHTTSTQRSINATKALYLAESGISYAGSIISNNTPQNLKDNILTKTETIGGNTYAYNIIKLNPFQNQKALSNITQYYQNPDVSVKISALKSSLYNTNTNIQFTVEATATVGKKTKIIKAILQKNYPSKVFDYVYFLNNWGYAFGSSITLNGDVRSNGHYGIKDKPTINGYIYASGNIHKGTNYNEKLTASDVAGWAAYQDPVTNQYPFWKPQSKKVEMPNLYKTVFYENLAKEKNGKIWIAPPGVPASPSNTVIDSVYGDDAGEKQNLILAPKPGEVIHIDGPVVIRGNLIIKGKITGKGCFYVGKNLYLAGDIEYQNPADYNNIPSNLIANDYEDKLKQWVQNNKDKDLVAFAVQENIIGGDWTKKEWSPNQYKSMWLNWGNEDVGRDGIPNTGDEGENDGIWNPAYEDVDGDGVQDDNYTYGDIYLNAPAYNSGAPSQNLSIADFDNVPTGITDFKDLYNNIHISKVDGIYYTNHFFTASVKDAVFRGSLISKDEGIVYTNYLKHTYDWRIHSKFRDVANFDLKVYLPVNFNARIIFWEIVK